MDYQGFKFILLFNICINSIFISEGNKEEVLLDMVALGSELGWLKWPDENGWEVAQTVFNGSLHYNYFVCNVEGPAGQNNWLRTTFIQRHPMASRVFVELRFVVQDCNSFNSASLTCKKTFNLYASDSDADIGTSFCKNNFRKVATIAPDGISKMGHLKMNTETRVVENLSRKGFYLAFQDNGICVALFSVRVYYKICPATIKSLAAFPEMVAGGTLREVAGQCVENAVSANQPLVYCTVEGEWVVPVIQCQCRERYKAFGNECQGPPETPVVAIKGPKQRTEGGNVTLTCSSYANPPVENYTWFKVGESTPVGSGHLYSITSEDGGQYYCEARNRFGSQVSITVSEGEGEQRPLVTAVIISVLAFSVSGAAGLLCVVSKKCKTKATHTQFNQNCRDVSEMENSDATRPNMVYHFANQSAIYQSLDPNTTHPDAIYQSLYP